MTVEVFVEIPKGSRNKYEFDSERGIFRLDRMLSSSVQYPCDYGYVPETLAQDGDPLDALVLLWEPTFSGCLIESRPVGLFRMEDEEGPDEKVLCVPIRDPVWNGIEQLEDVPEHLLVEIRHFFSIYKELEGKPVTVWGWSGRGAAEAAIEKARKRRTT